MKRWCVGLFCAIVLAVVGGCRRSPTAPTDSGAPARVVRVAPAKLLTGELGRLSPHLDLTATGCLRLDAPDEDLFFGFEPELWEMGKPRTLGSSKSRVRGPSEVSFSIREAHDSKGGRVYRLVTAVATPSGQGASHSYTAAVPEVSDMGQMSRAVDLAEPRELAEGEVVPVWAFVVRTDGRMDGEPLEEAVKKARWALVVKARWERPENR
ncbi:hypothetical protein GobsT_66270 [Gemmata obscuriglobus]|uniref:Uncharacterized protein n=1 Tax=Gemmata obscuriglobus TaxID=114 RepID=A0A2Z3GNA2_9BACT|nr:hypothetical protein [Gemmata obscuriglobus]AWM35689.1 hypothetical protein C1280_00725 [Gemmata obscuriglobus]QEG31783.1 hypothetical protein GobsT_66270 [Gemmata obscuriglobus]VTS11128.1 Uncharacterized protein OS=Clostridium botulinum D str. 16868 GN=Z953_02350 PE=4 SV=1 [Gemmata obscuriglobus UQM 2246]